MGGGVDELLAARCLFNVEYLLPELIYNYGLMPSTTINETKWFIIKCIRCERI